MTAAATTSSNSAPVVVVTRPANQADPLLARLSALSYRGLHLPMLRIEPLADAAALAAVKSRINALSDVDFVIFISSNAVHFCRRLCDELGLKFATRALPIVLGEATAKALRDWLQPEAMLQPPIDAQTSEGVLAMPALRQLLGRRVMIVRGVGGREVLAQQFRARGAEVEYCEVYARTQPSYTRDQLIASFEGMDVQAVLFSSSEAMKNFADTVVPAIGMQRFSNTFIVVSSSRLANAAKQCGFDRVRQSANAGVDATCEVLRACLG